MAGLDLSNILSQALTYDKAVDSNTSKLLSNASTGQAVHDTNADLYSTIGSNKVIIDNAKQSADLAVQNAKIKGANALGTNLRDQGELLTALATTIHTEYAARDAAARDIEAKQSVGFFDDPLQWVTNQFTINDDIVKHNAANARLHNAETQMATLNQLTQSTNLTQTQLAEPITAASMKASADNILSEAQVNANTERLKGLTLNSEGIKAALYASKEHMANAFSVFGAQKQEQQISIALAHLAMDRERLDMQKEQKRLGDAFADNIIDMINKGGENLQGDAYKPIEKGSAKAATIINAVKSNTSLGAAYDAMYKSGVESDVAGTRMIASSPAKAMEVMNSLPVKLSPGQAKVKELMDTVYGEIRTSIQAGNLDPKDQHKVAELFDKRVKELYNEQARVIRPGDANNINATPSLKVLIAQSPTVAQLPVVTKVLGPVIAAGGDITDDQIFSLTAKALKDKKISYAEALEATTIAHVGTRVNMEDRQLLSVGITPKYSKNVELTVNPIATMGGKEIVNMADPVQFGRALNTYLAAASNPFAQNAWR
jgi:hypothetical protein